MKASATVHFLSPESSSSLTAAARWRHPRVSASLSPAPASSSNTFSEPGSPMNPPSFSEPDFYIAKQMEDVKLENGFDSSHINIQTSQTDFKDVSIYKPGQTGQWGPTGTGSVDYYENDMNMFYGGDGRSIRFLPPIDTRNFPPGPNEPLSGITDSTINSTVASSSSEQYGQNIWASHQHPQQLGAQQTFFSKDNHGRKRSSSDVFPVESHIDPALLASTSGHSFAAYRNRTDSLDLAVQDSQYATQPWVPDNVSSTTPPTLSAYRTTVASPAVKQAAVKKRKDHTQRLFYCPSCREGLTTRQNLKYHLDAHAGVRPFSCQYCLKTFGTPHVCKRHESKCPNRIDFVPEASR